MTVVRQHYICENSMFSAKLLKKSVLYVIEDMKMDDILQILLFQHEVKNT